MSKDEALLRIFQAVPVPIVVASPLTARIIWVNQRLVEMYGAQDADAVVGRSLFDFIDAVQVAKAMADMAKVAAGYSPPPVTYQLRRASGEFAAGQVASTPLMFQGKPAMLSFVTDVSERERLVRSLREGEERYESLLESLPGGVVVVLGDHIVYANSALARALGFDSPRELLEKRMFRFIHPDQRDAVRQARERMLARNEAHTASPVTLVRRDGSFLETTAASTVIHWEGELATQTLMSDLGASAVDT